MPQPPPSTDDPELPTTRVGAPVTAPTGDTLPPLAGMRRIVDPIEQGRARSELMNRLFLPDDETRSSRRYELGQIVGQGGCGVVYEAYDSQLARKVAVKLLNPQSEEGTERAARGLLAEARAVASLTHPNVVAVYDAGQSLPGYDSNDTDAVYVVMELIDGQTLRTWGKTRRPWREVVRLYMQAGKGLAAAHERRLVHRDFKPGNVMLDRTGRVVVLDFGLAISNLPIYRDSVEWDPDSDLTLSMQSTRTQGLVGTPAYMAPEQLAGEELDPRCDQFSFCVALYETLVGQRPFGDDRLRMAEVIRRGVNAHPPPQLDALEEVAPAWLGRVIGRGLEIDPSRRYPSMESLLGALKQGLGRLRRRALGAVLAAGVTTASVATFFATRASVDPCPSATAMQAELWSEDTRAAVHRSFQDASPGAAQPDAERLWSILSGSIDAYVTDLADARVDACRTAQVGDAQASRAAACLDVASIQLQVATELLGSSDSDLMARAADMVGELPPIGECAVGKMAGFAPQPTDLEIERLLARAAVVRMAGHHEDARSHAQNAYDEAIRQGDRSAEARAAIALGWIEITHDSKSIESAEQRFHAALVAAEAANDARSELLALAGSIHAVGVVGARHAEADRFVEHAMAKLDGHSVGPSVESKVRRVIGLLRYREYRYEDARVEYERSEQLLRLLTGNRSIELADRAIELGNVATQLNEHAIAKEHFERAQELVLESGGPEHPRMKGVFNGLGLVALSSGQFREAKEWFRKLRDMHTREHGPEHPALAVSLINEARAIHGLGNYEAEVPLYDEALRIRRRYHGERHPSVARTLANRANVMRQLGRHEESVANLRDAANILETAGPSQYVPMAMILVNVGQTHRELEQWSEAAEAVGRAWELMNALPEPPKHTMVMIEAELAISLFKRDGDGAGREHIEHAYSELSSLNVSKDEMVLVGGYLAPIIASEQPERALKIAQEGVAHFCADEQDPRCPQVKALLESLQDPK